MIDKKGVLIIEGIVNAEVHFKEQFFLCKDVTFLDYVLYKNAKDFMCLLLKSFLRLMVLEVIQQPLRTNHH